MFYFFFSLLGLGDMAVSNAIGSNVFDILLCLGLPWFLMTVIVEPGSTVRVRSRGELLTMRSIFSSANNNKSK